MPRPVSSILAVLCVAAPLPAAADPDLVLVTAEDAPVAAEEVEAILDAELPDLRVSTDVTDATGVARVTIATWADGRLAIWYRDAEGRETLRLVEPGPRPASTVAMVVVNLQEDQLDTVLGPPAAPVARRASRASPAAHARAVVRPSPVLPEALSLGAGLGVLDRKLEVEVVDSAPRTFAITAPVLAVEATVFPARFFRDTGPASWLGLELALRRAVAMQPSAPTASGAGTVDLDAAYQDVAANLLVDVPLTSGAAGPRLRLAGGWSQVSFQFAAEQMMLLDESLWTASFHYQGIAASARLHLPLGGSGLRAHAGVALHWVPDVGQEVRDLYGSDTGGAIGYGAQAGLGGTIVSRLDWSTTFELRQFQTEMSGVSASAGGRVGAFPAASDRYLAAWLALTYTAN